jgi:hypothetical protein
MGAPVSTSRKPALDADRSAAVRRDQVVRATTALFVVRIVLVTAVLS